ncbi:MAG: twin-arginine translocase TatA/TatE family subunit [Gemmatimonadota bacterium]|nr:twin-arginine translocase TatA/TatE family subunit [Gemmatimonadota bacterium]
MGLGNLGFTEIMIIGVVILLLFGARRLPEIGAGMGKGIREFKKSLSDVGTAINEPTPTDRIDRPRAADPAAKPGDDDHPEPKRLLS